MSVVMNFRDEKYTRFNPTQMSKSLMKVQIETDGSFGPKPNNYLLIFKSARESNLKKNS